MTKSFKTADLYDEFGDRLQVCEPGLRHYGGRRNFYGRIETIKCFEDNSRVAELVATPGEGRVLVVDAGGSKRCAMLGDMLAQKAVDNGWAGVVMFGCIRDSEEISTMPLGVMALGTLPKKSVKRNCGESGLDVCFAGVLFRPGTWLYADGDGILIAENDLFAAR